jgi:hypothetical protein
MGAPLALSGQMSDDEEVNVNLFGSNSPPLAA